MSWRYAHLPSLPCRTEGCAHKYKVDKDDDGLCWRCRRKRDSVTVGPPYTADFQWSPEEHAALLIECPYCKAKPQEVCDRPSGEKYNLWTGGPRMHGIHSARKKQAGRLAVEALVRMVDRKGEP